MPAFRRVAVVLLCLVVVCLEDEQVPAVAQTANATGLSSPQQATPQQTSPTTASITTDVTGRVLNSQTHQPIARALVQMGSRRVLTDHDGIFRLPEVTTRTGTFRITKPGFFPSLDDGGHAYTFPVDAPIDLTLFPEAIVSGNVIDTAGEPVPHISIVARSSSYNDTGHHWFPSGRAQTLSDGSFRLSLPAGTYALQMLPNGRAVAGTDALQPLTVPANPTSLNDAIHLAPGDQVHLDLRPSLRRTFGVTLRLEHGLEHGFPMLTARRQNGPSFVLNSFPNRDDPGTFQVALPNGTYEILADMQNQEGRQQGRTSVTVAGHDVSGVALSLSPIPTFPVAVEVDSSATADTTLPVPTATQLGLLLNSVASAADFSEQVATISSRGSTPSTFALAEGTYRLHARSGGTWYVVGATCGGTDLLQQNLIVAPGTGGVEIRVRISNRTADVAGTTQLGAVPAPVWVYLISTTPSAGPIIYFRSGPSGSFSHSYVPPGSYRAIALEHQVTVDLQNPETLNRFRGHVQTLTLNPGDHATLNLNAVAAAELTP